jgi:hypothetical protein
LAKNISGKKVMFIVHTESLGGKGIYSMYQEMKKIGHKVQVVAIPLFNGWYSVPLDKQFLEKFDKNNVIYPCGINPPYIKCESIESYKPDYLFIQNPYNVYSNSILDPNFINDTLKLIAKKIVYVPYGPHIFHQDIINDKKLPNFVDLVFVDSESTKNIYIEKYGFKKDNVVVSGYCTYKEIRDIMNNGIKVDRPETILWLPRWTLNFKHRDQFEGGSTFLNYHYFFYNYALKNSKINFIIRPHQSLLFASSNQNLLTQEEIDQIFEKFRSLPNVTVSDSNYKPLVQDIIQSDIIISDGTSALAEVVVADKPIIYLSNGWNNEFNSNTLSKELKKYVYLAYSHTEIMDYIEKIRQDHYAPVHMHQENTINREKFKNMLDPVENPGKFIAEYLLNN